MFYWFRLFMCVFFSFPFCCCCCCVCIAYDKCKYVSGLICQTWKIIAVGFRITYITFSGAIKLIIVLYFFSQYFGQSNQPQLRYNQYWMCVCFAAHTQTHTAQLTREFHRAETQHTTEYIYIYVFIYRTHSLSSIEEMRVIVKIRKCV